MSESEEAVPTAVAATTLEQRRAATPRTSAWVSANAGSGKTKVLSDRVVRLLLDGVKPGKILCLTFTKAAAANMSIRIFDMLGSWVTMADAELARELEKLEGKTPDAARLAAARRLFAHAVETPGGLKIETIHAFCERLLHLVPFEAQVPAGFAVLDEARGDELRGRATDAVLARTLDEPALADAHEIVAVAAGGEHYFNTLRAAIDARRERAQGELDEDLARLPAVLGLAPENSGQTLGEALLGPLGEPEWRRIATALRTAGSATNNKRADAILAALSAPDTATRLACLTELFCTSKGERRSERDICTQKTDASIKELLIEEQARFIAIRAKLHALDTLARTRALYRLASAIVAEIDREKSRLGALDFDDLIARTAELLRRGDAEWMLYKLDRGIDHVLVDEAQDTNPDQWEILRRITEDFTSGAGARSGLARTFFAVGDPKQSIYGFQGAEPRSFEDEKRRWRRRSADAGLPFEDVALTVSFRSARRILKAVDATFAVPAHFEGLSFDDRATGTVHETSRGEAPGTVELWPPEEPIANDEPQAWDEPLDTPGEAAPSQRVANRIACAVETFIKHGDESGRRYRAKDILILMRKRGAAFAPTIRALKDQGIAVAGADRIDVGAHIAVLDLVAIGRAALLPEDDLTLATALKTPPVGFDEDALFRLAADRGDTESLAAALARLAADGDPDAIRGRDALAQWRELAARETPYGFYATLLGPMGARRRIVGRLGAEAADAVDTFLAAAFDAERPETPSLATFLARFTSAPHVVKRELDAARDEVRVMTVHGAKGLEAPVVFLVDDRAGRQRADLLLPVDMRNGRKLPVWAGPAANDGEALKEAREACRRAAAEESNRLLYVALTRAADRLVVAPFGKAGSGLTWSTMLRAGLEEAGDTLESREMPYGTVELLRDLGPTPADKGREDERPAFLPPPWLHVPVPDAAPTAAPLAPSRAVAGRAASQATRLRGRLVHALLEQLPAATPGERSARAVALARTRAPDLTEVERATAIAEALRVIDHPDLAALFAPGSRAEAWIAGEVALGGEMRPVEGRIDRFAALDDTVWLAEFKAGAPPPAGAPVSPAQGAQLSLYAALLAGIFPEKRLRPFLIWTSGGEGPAWRELDPAAREAALASIKRA